MPAQHCEAVKPYFFSRCACLPTTVHPYTTAFCLLPGPLLPVPAYQCVPCVTAGPVVALQCACAYLPSPLLPWDRTCLATSAFIPVYTTFFTVYMLCIPGLWFYSTHLFYTCMVWYACHFAFCIHFAFWLLVSCHWDRTCLGHIPLHTAAVAVITSSSLTVWPVRRHVCPATYRLFPIHFTQLYSFLPPPQLGTHCRLPACLPTVPLAAFCICPHYKISITHTSHFLPALCHPLNNDLYFCTQHLVIS